MCVPKGSQWKATIYLKSLIINTHFHKLLKASKASHHIYKHQTWCATRILPGSPANVSLYVNIKGYNTKDKTAITMQMTPNFIKLILIRSAETAYLTSIYRQTKIQ